MFQIVIHNLASPLFLCFYVAA